ncbi:uncharacterized protein LOC129579194 isoform X1 [Sitodiplosis mosellana]|uniref:uncharacterized protein LOC129579194 isoform X1 n=1 Tax=Sitodiplosis mosellana TaxID=263140 RepID=UPI0024443C31|nr:uncharacterized protein LOC129579194 isoform X1 [Sitodiplosis mosellana]
MDDINFPRFDNNQNHFNRDTFFKDSFYNQNKDFEESFAFHQKVFFTIFGIVAIFMACIIGLVIFSICFRICKGQSYQDYRRQRRCQTIIPPPPPLTNPSPVVVTTTTIPTVPQSAGYPAQSTIVQGYPMPQPQPGYPPQPAGMYPNQPMPQPYPMPPIQADYNPPSYDQVVRGGDAYQKQAPYNPNYSGQQ